MARSSSNVTPLLGSERPAGGRASRSAGVERRQQMLEAAARLFSVQSYHATTMRQIAEATGLLPGSLYAHIRSKEELLYEIVREAAHAFLEGLETARTIPASPEDRFRSALAAHVDVITAQQASARVFHHEWRALTGRRREEIRRLRDRYEGEWDEILEALPGVEDPKLPRLMVLSVANWVYTWYEPDGGLTPERIAERFADLLLGGLTAGAAADPGKIPSGAKERAR